MEKDGKISKEQALRFRGFEGEWEEKKLGELADIIGGGTPSTSVPEFWNGNIDWYAPAEIGDQIYLSTSQQKITKKGYLNSSAKMLPIGTVLFTSRVGIGKSAILKREGCTNQGFQSIVPHPDLLDSYFTYSRTSDLKKYGETIGARSTFLEVSGKQMAEMDLLIPPTMAEQQKIGLYFSQLDRLLSLQQQKLNKLEDFKKAMLDKMFPQKGSMVPEIRFKGFTGNWKKYTLEEITERFDNLRIPITSNLRVSGRTPYYGANGIQDYVDGYTHDGEFVLLAEDGANDPLNYPVFFVQGKIWVNNHAHVLQGKPFIVDNRFLAFAIGQLSLGSLLVGGSRPKLNAGTMMNLQIAIPTLIEQQQIGQFFSHLDRLISLNRQKLEKLQSLKKAMLGQMFPAPPRQA